MSVSRIVRGVGLLGLTVTPLVAQSRPAPAITYTPYTLRANDGTTVEAELGAFEVPERRAATGSRRITLRFVRLRSTSATLGDPIIYLAGGPGASGIRTASGARFPLFMALRALGDVIALDQRGVGQSSPLPPCQPSDSLDPVQPVTRTALVDLYRRGLTECMARWTASGIDIDGYTTRENAADIDDLRRALGARQVRLWGISYGSHLGLAVLKYHGAGISRAVFAGIEGLEQTVKLPAYTDSLVARVQALINRDSVLRAAYPDVAATMRRVHARLDSAPVRLSTTPPGGRTPVTASIDAFPVQLLVGGMIADPPGIARVPLLYAALDAGRYEFIAGPLLQQMPSGAPRFAGMPELMDIASGIDPARRALVATQATRGVLGDALNFPMPQLDGLRPSLDLGASFRAPFRSDVPVLFLSGTLDGRTAVDEGRTALRGLRRGTQVIVEHGGHNLFEADQQVADAVVAFLRGEAVPARIVLRPPTIALPPR
ncbi:MAG: alpha/beta hydrolase [Gemmatimonadaceae bacterium]|jgi:pimeloyl-ACP methyl ester carboxylesterase|nr:alpha/beta hydrolase [Gemmatimonadaceae bacterium]